MGEDTGCLALGRVFHTACLNCYKCGKLIHLVLSVICCKNTEIVFARDASWTREIFVIDFQCAMGLGVPV